MTAAGAVNPRTQALLQAPLVPTLLKLAAPNVLGLVATTVTIAYDGWVVGRLGADALAGVALVFPVAMLMVQMSGGGIGGATTAAVARALGAGQRAQADTLVVQALWVAFAFAALFTLLMVPFGPSLFGAFGGRGAAITHAQSYGATLFSGALVVWVTNVLAGAVRGSGQMALASALLVASAALHLVLCPLLVFGFGAWPGLGVAGAAASTLVSNALAGGVLAWRLLSGRGPLSLPLQRWQPRAEPMRALLRVGLPAMLSPVLSNGSIAVATAWIATLGTAALAGYGLAARLEYIVVPISFGFGTALTALVATNLGARQRERALRATWTGALLVMGVTGAIGVASALWPVAWMQQLSRNPEVVAFGADYLRVVGGCYGLFGLGLALFFASQGAGRMFWPLVASVSRLLVVALGGWLVLKLSPGQPQALFAVVAAGFVVYAGTIAASIALGRWASA